MDRVDDAWLAEAELTTIEERLRSINQFAPIQRCTQSAVSVNHVLNIYGFDLTRAIKASPELLNPNAKHGANKTAAGSTAPKPAARKKRD